MISIPLTYSHDPERHPAHWPVTRGVPMPVGIIRETDGLTVVNPDGDRVPAQFRVLARWADGSVKWVLVDFQADADTSGTATYNLTDEAVDESPAIRQPTTYASTTFPSVCVEETVNNLHVDTGVLRFRIDRHRYRLFHVVSLGDTQLGNAQLGSAQHGDAQHGNTQPGDTQRGDAIRPARNVYGTGPAMLGPG